MEREHKSRATVIRILKRIPIFFGLLDREYDILVDVCRWVQFQAGERIFAEGERSHEMYVLLAGQVQIVKENAGVAFALQPGELLGEIAMVSPLPRTASAVVEQNATLLRISLGDLENLLGRAPRVSYLIMRNIAEALATRLAATTGRIQGEEP